MNAIDLSGWVDGVHPAPRLDDGTSNLKCRHSIYGVLLLGASALHIASCTVAREPDALSFVLGGHIVKLLLVLRGERAEVAVAGFGSEIMRENDTPASSSTPMQTHKPHPVKPPRSLSNSGQHRRLQHHFSINLFMDILKRH